MTTTRRFRIRRRRGSSSIAGRDGRAGHGGDRVLRRFDHRRHALHAERRRSLARRASRAAFTLSTAIASPSSTPASAATGIISPATYSIEAPIGGGPSALERLDRDVLSISGLTAIVWLEGINDLAQGASAEEVIAGMREVARRVQAQGGIKLIAATLTSSVGSTTPHGTPDAEARRQAINTFIRTSGIFAGVADFDAATRDDSTGGLRAAFVPNSTIGGPGDRLHPNRAGYLRDGTGHRSHAAGPVRVRPDLRRRRDRRKPQSVRVVYRASGAARSCVSAAPRTALRLAPFPPEFPG